MAELLRDGRRQKLLRCPAGAWPVRRGHRGPRPLVRACPRLISCGVPPGRSAKRRRHFSGGLLVASAPGKILAAREDFGARAVSARSTSPSRRLATCGHHALFARSEPFAARPAASRRHRRLPVCATSVAAPPLCTTTLQNPRAPRGFFPERGGVRGAPAAAGCPHGTPPNPTGACGVSRPLRLVLGGHSRAPWVAAPPLGVHRVAVVHLPWLDRIVTTKESPPRRIAPCPLEIPLSFEL